MRETPAIRHNCPLCGRRNTVPGQLGIATMYPELMPEWDDDRDPRMILPGSHKMIGWQCPRGHRYQAMPYSRTRTRRAGCPYCTGRYKAKDQV